MSPALTGRILLVLWSLVTPVCVLASDEVGIFFDEGGRDNCIQAEPFATLEAYLLLLEPTVSVIGWECSLEVDNLSLVEVTLAGQGFNAGSGSDFYVGLTSPLPYGLAVKLAQVAVLLMGGGSGGFYIYPASVPSLEGTPVYADGSNPTHLLPMTPRTISGDALVAGVNMPNCLPEQTTWGRVKSIYQD
jgi:hypothetical protein